MNQPLLFDPPPRHCQSELGARDEALDRVTRNAGHSWREQAAAIVRAMTGEATGEDIRLECHRLGIDPHHPNAWGGFICTLIRDGRLIPTERYRPMRASGSHARKTQIYRIASSVHSTE